MTDEELVRFTRQGDSEALDFLITKYKPLVRIKAKSYFLIGADKEDIIQEGMIGLFKAVRDFSGVHQASFKAFAELCITRQIITAIKTATRQKHIPLNSYVSLDKPVGDEDQASTLMDLLQTDASEDPANFVVHREQFLDMESRINELLSPFEQKVLALYIDGCSYQEISEQLKRHMKSIDNALQRIKRKLEQQLTAN